MKQFAALVRVHVTKQQRRQRDEGTDQRGATTVAHSNIPPLPPSPTTGQPFCALCGLRGRSPFLATFRSDTHGGGVDSRRSSIGKSVRPAADGTRTPVDIRPAASPNGQTVNATAVKLSDLCCVCFRMAFKAIVRPLLADEVHRSRVAGLLAETAAAAADADRAVAAAARRLKPLHAAERWACPRCTYAGNAGTDDKCQVCQGAAPHVTSCLECGLKLTPALLGVKCKGASRGGPGSPTPVKVMHVHEVWQCDKCTCINTVDRALCCACSTGRGWDCVGCGMKNYSRRAPNGERCCMGCGHIDKGVTASTAASFGLDPKDVLREQAQQEAVRQNLKRLDVRLDGVGLARFEQRGDGNCQFRALAHQLFGTPDLHMLVRNMVTTHMSVTSRGEFEILFERPCEFEEYLVKMRRDGTWGDEMTLRAAADSLGCHVHVITSDVEKWHIHYKPAPLVSLEPALKLPEGFGTPEQRPTTPPPKKFHPADTSSSVAATPSPNPSLSTTERNVLKLQQSEAMGPATALDASIMAPVRQAVELEAERSTLRFSASRTAGFVLDWPDEGEDGYPHVFVAYQSPVHYDDVCCIGMDKKTGQTTKRPLGRHTVDMCSIIERVIAALAADEHQWDDASDVVHQQQQGSNTVAPIMGSPTFTDEWHDVGNASTLEGGPVVVVVSAPSCHKDDSPPSRHTPTQNAAASWTGKEGGAGTPSTPPVPPNRMHLRLV